MSIPTPPPERQSAYPHQTPPHRRPPRRPPRTPRWSTRPRCSRLPSSPSARPARAGRARRRRHPDGPVGRRRALLGRRRRHRPRHGAHRPRRRADRRPDPRHRAGGAGPRRDRLDGSGVRRRRRARSIAAGGLLHLLVLSTPKPRAFFGWIMFLATLTAALLPLTWTDVLESAIAVGPGQRPHRDRDLVPPARRAEPHAAPRDARRLTRQSTSRACSSLPIGQAPSAVVPRRSPSAAPPGRAG